MAEADSDRERPVLLPALVRHPGHLLWRAQARVVVLMAQTLPAGTDIHGYAVLTALADGVPRSQQALAAIVGVSRTTLAKLAADLADRGLVQRVRNPADRRSYALTRTTAGASAARRWERHARDLDAAVADPFDPAELDELRRLLRSVVEPDLPADAPEALRRSVAFLLHRTKHRVSDHFAASLAPLGVDPRHTGALTVLSTLGPVPQVELARALGVSGASMVQLVDELEDRGLVERRRLESDRRTQVLHLLPRSEEVLARARPLAAAAIEDRLAPLTPAEVDRLSLLLVRLITAG